MYTDYKSLTEEDLDKKITDLQSKMEIAYRLGQEHVIEQLQHHLDELKLEYSERFEKMKFDLINQRTPNSMVIGEDDEPTDGDDNTSEKTTKDNKRIS
tara:strand:- start:1978 stop:2271 length:294 start_codon:yes stop_codon:yes gene_type:complete